MGKPYYGSINFTELLNAANAGHSAFIRAGKKKEVFVRVTLWENDDEDEFGNTHSLQVNPDKEAPDNNKEGRFYIANFKPTIIKKPKGLKPGEIEQTDDDLYVQIAPEKAPDEAPEVKKK